VAEGSQFKVTIEGGSQIDATLASMVDQINKLGTEDMATELTTWQTEDMHRKYPNTKQDDEKTVSTEIWPRSRVSMTADMLMPFIKGKRTKVYAPPRATGAATHHRPILRSELFNMLCVRMSALMSRTLKWQIKA
jgi:transcription termination factor Rho